MEVADSEYNEKLNYEKFYKDAEIYWNNITADIDGMLGGLGHISSIDISTSMKFLKQFIKHPLAKTETNWALDCGAGIGRITKLLLLPLFEQVDLVEQNKQFLNAAAAHIGLEQSSRVGRYICAGLQNFTPDPNLYDVIWCQWVLGHLTDSDLIDFLRRAKSGLTSNGIIILKENISASQVEFDSTDSSYTRPLQHFYDIFDKADLRILKELKQKSFPSDLFEVRMFALQ